MATNIIYGTYSERIAYSAAESQWWFQTDVGMDGATTYESGYYLFDNSEWGYFAGAGTTANFTKTTFATGESPVIVLQRYTNNPNLMRASQYNVVVTGGTGGSSLGVSQEFLVQDDSNLQPLGDLGFVIFNSDSNQNGAFVVRIRGPNNVPSASNSEIYSLTSDLLQYFKFRGDVSNGLCYGEVIKAVMYNPGTAVASTTDETSLLTGGMVGSLTYPANFWNDDNGIGIARTFEIFASGIFGTTGTPTLQLRLFLGGSAILSTTALTMPNTVTNVGWEYHALVTCQSTGASGTFRGQGRWHYHTSTAGAPSTAATTLDTTGTLAVDLMADWGTNNASNTITCTNFVMKVIA